MALSSLLLFLLIATSVVMTAQAVTITNAGLQLISTDTTLEWPSYSLGGEEHDDEDGGFRSNDDDEEGAADADAAATNTAAAATNNGRRSLFWWRVHRYYISYGALSANRIPCRPRSGRSYYTHYCYHARGRANPYTRGCSAITRCRR